jgi:hypothetical protein
MTENTHVTVDDTPEDHPDCLSCVRPERPIFVFGSNLEGRHGKGAALHAVKCHKAIYGEGWGRQGRSYAIPTKDAQLKTLPITDISVHVEWFRAYAKLHEHEDFFVTRLGCGLAGYRDEDIAPLFHDMPKNVLLPAPWVEILSKVEPVVADTGVSPVSDISETDYSMYGEI